MMYPINLPLSAQHAVGYPFDCPNIVRLIAFRSINQTPKHNYPSQLEKTSGYRKENRKSFWIHTHIPI